MLTENIRKNVLLAIESVMTAYLFDTLACCIENFVIALNKQPTSFKAYSLSTNMSPKRLYKLSLPTSANSGYEARKVSNPKPI